MKLNVGTAEQIIRIILGGALMVLAYMGIIGVWGYIGIIFVVTGLISWCPIWAILKIDTRKSVAQGPGE